ncbi:MAG TPA: cobalt-precorrin-6A reductase [Stellaceae bacterium]|nr:cobalt-precorrin-6A reductase [Stellaceae bacterium]
MKAPRRPTLLILGGTGEAAALARNAVARFGDGLLVVTSLAGRTASPAPLPGAVRSGGFGGADGLATYLRETSIDLVVDATHPFAAQISRHARLACDATGTARIALVRPPWRREGSDRWIAVPDMAAAARALPGLGRRALLTIGARELDAFAACEGVAFVVRLMEQPRAPPKLAGAALVLARPPFSLDEERLLLHRHGIEIVVAKASGGARPAKLDAAREVGLPVLLVERPPSEPGPSVASVADTIAWIGTQIGVEARA